MKYVTFLRGINVVGKNKVKMETLREVCAALGFENVRTYINSGNVIFETAKTADKKLAAAIAAAIEKEFSLSIKVLVRSVAEIKEIIANNPFAGQFESEKDMHVLFLDDELPEEKRDQLLSKNNQNEIFAVGTREIYCLLRISFPDSLLGKDFVGRTLKVSATARNWRTVNKVLEF